MAVYVDCPTCRRRTEFSPQNRWRPFCSERCKMIDLGAWASGRYAIPGSEPDPEDQQPPDRPED
jgi:uncharacterized protein